MRLCVIFSRGNKEIHEHCDIEVRKYLNRNMYSSLGRFSTKVMEGTWKCRDLTGPETELSPPPQLSCFNNFYLVNLLMLRVSFIY